ncbi:META domain-containing protein [Hymenobacter sp. BT559]|uniref:META domain-containing protein n=1 Tax=Hymenobacter sp. BT559 TaxID=2795729 RepID=UPI0018EC9B9D|nr:META domain-containing protein [Hymenobacter sp. BT559]MBJ6146233.1 META domain-containing protein [Hymenobacter sp. BT559]
MLRSAAALVTGLGLFCLGCQTTNSVTTSTPTTEARPPAPGAALFETRWVLRQVGTQQVTVPEGGQEPYLLLRRTGAAEGQGSCNRFRSTAATDSTSHLVFTPLMSTRMACPALPTEQAFTQALATAHSFRISGDTLRLYAATEPDATPLARLEAVYLR